MKNDLIFIIDSPFPYYSGGRETWLFHVLNRLIKEYNILLINKRNYRKKKPFFKLDKKIKIITVSIIPRFLKISWPFSTLFQVLNSYLFAVLIYYKLKNTYKNKNERPLIITLNPGFCSYPALLLKKKGFKYLCCVRGQYAYESVQKCFWFKNIWFKLFRKVEVETLKKAEKVFLNGKDTKENLKKYLNSQIVKKFKILPNGVNFKEFAEAKITNPLNIEEDIIMTVATLRDIKGIPKIIKSIPYVARNNKNTKFIFVGKGNQQPYIKLAKRLNVLKYIEFLGERIDITNLLKQAKIALTISGGSGLAHSTLEALASGTIVIGLDNLTYSQIIENGKNGFLVRENDSKELGKKINYILKNYERLEPIKNNAVKSAQKYDWSNIVEQLISEINEFPSN